MDFGESTEEALRREAREGTGLTGFEMTAQLTP